MTTRIEKDSMGKLDVPINALYGAQTQCAINNFPISHQKMPETFIRSLVVLKESAAKANAELGCITKKQAEGIIEACKKLLASENYG